MRPDGIVGPTQEPCLKKSPREIFRDFGSLRVSLGITTMRRAPSRSRTILDKWRRRHPINSVVGRCVDRNSDCHEGADSYGGGLGVGLGIESGAGSTDALEDRRARLDFVPFRGDLLATATTEAFPFRVRGGE